MPHDGSLEGDSRAAKSTQIEKSFPADFRWVRRSIHEIEEELENIEVSSEDIGSISIVLAEALNNVVEHAFKGKSGGTVRIVVRQRRNSLMFEIRDNGRPMPNGKAPTGDHPVPEGTSLDALPEGGYGWFLIRELVQDLVYDRDDGENILFFRYRLQKAA